MENTKEEIQNWNIADSDGNIHIPDYLDKFANNVVTQIRFHTISGKNEIQTVCDIVHKAESFFTATMYTHSEVLKIAEQVKEVCFATMLSATSSEAAYSEVFEVDVNQFIPKK